MIQGVLERRILLPLLVCYAVILVAAAWRHEIRPQLLDRPAAWARSALDLAGIPPAVAVFTTETSTPQNAKLVALCLRVRIRHSRSANRHLSWERGGRCAFGDIGQTGAQIARFWRHVNRRALAGRTCRDRFRQRATTVLRERFPTWTCYDGVPVRWLS